MLSRKWLAGLAVVGMLSVGIMMARADGDAKPAAGDAPKETHRGVKVDAPYNLLTDLTDDQKAKIIAIHTATLDAEKKLKDQETTDITALLTDDQKKELVAAEAKLKEERKAEMEARRAKEMADKALKLQQKATQDAATTQPPAK